MAGLFGNRSPVHLSPRQDLERKYELGRSNLMFAIILTAINIVAPIFGADLYFMFSLYVPTELVLLGMLFCGMYPEEVYTEAGLDGLVFLDQAYFYVFVAIAVLITLVFLLCWFMSKGKKIGWMIAATALFTVDTLLILLNGLSFEYIFDILFHAWVLYYLVSAIVAYFKLKNLPEDTDGEGQQYDSVLDAFANPDPNNMQ